MTRFFLVGVLLLLARPAHAEVLTLERVFEGLRDHPLAIAARTGLDRADGEQQAAAGAFDVRVRARGEHTPIGFYDRFVLDAEVRVPTRVQGVSGFAGWRLGTGGIPEYDFKIATLERGEVRAGLEAPLLRDRSIDRARSDERRAVASKELARAEVRRRDLEIERDAAFAYWDWVAAGHRLEIRTRQLELARVRDQGLQRTIREGNTAAIEGVDNARVIAQREAFVVIARRDLQRAALELSLWLRDTAGLPRVVTVDELPPLGDLPPPLFDESELAAALGRARTSQPIVAAFGARLSANAVDVSLAENQLLPHLNASVFASRGIEPADPALPDRSSAAFGVGLTFELPLERNQAEGSLAIARAERKRLQIEQQFAFARIEADVRIAVAELSAARERAVLAAEQERLARQLAEAEQQRFDRGDTTILVVNLREEATAEAAAARVDAVGEYFKVRARFSASLGLSQRDPSSWRRAP